MSRRLFTAGRLAKLLHTGVIGGIVLAALAYPTTVIAGRALQAGADAIEGMPSQLAIVPPPQTSYLYASDGRTLITSFYEEYRRYTSLADTSPWIQEAIVAAEDARFYQHHGVDLHGTIRAFVANNQAGQVSQGASTLTMQYVRNAERDAAATPQAAVNATERSAGRKLREMKLAVELEKRMTKAQILEGYLNVAYFGHRAYGIFAAAQIYFSTSPARLTLSQAAMLAGLVQAPTAYDPGGRNQTAARQRRDYVIDRMAQLGYVTAEQAAAAKGAPLALHLYNPPNDCTSVNRKHIDWGFFCDEFKAWWMTQAQFGANPLQRLDKLRTGGYAIVSTLDPKIQASALRHVNEQTGGVGNRFAVGSVFMEPGTGRIKAMAVNRIYSLNQSHNPLSSDPQKRRHNVRATYPRTVNMLLGGGPDAGYQAGSTFKYFVLLAALEKGYPLSTTIYAPERLMTRFSASGPGSCGGRWCPQNASGSDTGPQTIWSGWGKSVNTFWVQLEERVGPASAVHMAERLGLTWHNGVDRRLATRFPNDWGSFTLGTAQTTPLEMAAAYATVAADGWFCRPLAAQSIVGPDGQSVPVKPDCTRAVSQAVARGAVDAMRCTTGYGAARGSCGGWSTAPRAYATVGRPFAGKTGTTDDNRSAWFIGFTPQLIGAAFVADPDNPLDVAGGGRHDWPMTVIPATIHDAMRGKPVLGFTPPPSSVVNGGSH
ncbi:MAG: transglycosylase domain-containing protein [Micromonosporaceae bacterium]|nr:transglycosylase domain-containing protein [Micromonosporaceae bacterium]